MGGSLWGLVALISLGIDLHQRSRCTLPTATMIPVQGPLEVRPARFRSSGESRWDHGLERQDPVRASRWRAVFGPLVFRRRDGRTYAAGSLLSKYGSTYISGFSVGSGSAKCPAWPCALRREGWVFQLDFVHGDGLPHGFGPAKTASRTSTVRVLSLSARLARPSRRIGLAVTPGFFGLFIFGPPRSEATHYLRRRTDADATFPESEPRP